MAYTLKLIRVKSWIKNLLIFAPLFFDDKSKLFSSLIYEKGLGVFLSFSLICSAVYVFNDIVDRNDDRIHPVKRNRPIASGKVSIYQARITILLLLVFGFFLGALSEIAVLPYFFVYVAINFFYTKWIKNIPVMELIVVPLGFVIRLIIGAIWSVCSLSQWIILFVGFFSFFLIVLKRKEDVQRFTEHGVSSRQVSKLYTLDFINQLSTIFSVCTLITYQTYQVIERPNMSLSQNIINSVIVLLIVLRILFVTQKPLEQSSDPVELFYRDRVVLMLSLFFLISHSFNERLLGF